MPPLKFKVSVNPYFFRPGSKGFYSQSTLILFNPLSPVLLHSFPFSPQIPQVFLALIMFSLKPIYLLAFFIWSLFIFTVHTKSHLLIHNLSPPITSSQAFAFWITLVYICFAVFSLLLHPPRWNFRHIFPSSFSWKLKKKNLSMCLFYLLLTLLGLCCSAGFSLVAVSWGSGLLSNCGARASHCHCFSCCRAHRLGCTGFSSCGTWDE